MSLNDLFNDILPPQAILSSQEDRAFYGTDSCAEFKGEAALVLLPENTEQTSQIIKRCFENKIAVVPSGGRTGYSGGATALNQEIVVSTERMRQLGTIDLAARTLRCGAGVKTETIQQTASAAGLFYPVDFASRGSSCIGGNIATNAGGIRVLRYGLTRDWIAGLTLVTGTGEILNLNGELIKNQTGFDLRGLMIGSEGLLGIVTEAVVKLSEPARPSIRFLAGCNSLTDAIDFLAFLRRRSWVVTLCEYFDRRSLEVVRSQNQLRPPFSETYDVNLLLEVEGFESKELLEEHLNELIEKEVCQELIVAASSSQAEALLSYRDLISESLRKCGVPHKNDISIPIRKIPNFVDDLRASIADEKPQIDISVFGHLGDGNLHINILKPAQEELSQFRSRMHQLDGKVFSLVKKYEGSISAEHGVGLLKRQYLHYSRSEHEIAMMRQIKAIFDPGGILNPGKVF